MQQIFFPFPSSVGTGRQHAFRVITLKNIGEMVCPAWCILATTLHFLIFTSCYATVTNNSLNWQNYSASRLVKSNKY